MCTDCDSLGDKTSVLFGLVQLWKWLSWPMTDDRQHLQDSAMYVCVCSFVRFLKPGRLPASPQLISCCLCCLPAFWETILPK